MSKSQNKSTAKAVARVTRSGTRQACKSTEEMEMDRIREKRRALKDMTKKNTEKLGSILDGDSVVMPVRSTRSLTTPKEFTFSTSSRTRKRSVRTCVSTSLSLQYDRTFRTTSEFLIPVYLCAYLDDAYYTCIRPKMPSQFRMSHKRKSPGTLLAASPKRSRSLSPLQQGPGINPITRS